MPEPLRRPGVYAPDPHQLAQQALADAPADAPPDAAPEAAPEEPGGGETATPAERWRKALAARNLTEEQADAVLAAIMSQGYYERTYTFFNGKGSVVLRTRDGDTVQRVAEALDRVQTNDRRIHDQVMNRHNLAGSLVRYNQQAFKHPSPRAQYEERARMFAERLAFVDALPSPILARLYVLLGQFDGDVYAVTNEGAVQGF